MYQDYFGLRTAPFSIAPDPQFVLLTPQHREALAHLLYGAGEGGGFVLLTGEVGTGKTTICRCLLEQMPDDIDIAFIVNPRQSSLELLQSVCDELGVPYHSDEPLSIKYLVDQLTDFLLHTHRRGRRTLLIIDEAQNLDPEVLEQLRLLTNLETNETKLLRLILLGQPELREMLARPELRQLSQRITARYHLSPLTPADVDDYIRHRLEVAGFRGMLFTPGAVRRIFRLSRGIPRLVNVLCDRAMLGLYAHQGREVTPAIVTQAACEVLPPERARWLPWVGTGLVAVLLIVAVAFVWTRFTQAPAPSAAPAKPVAPAQAKPPVAAAKKSTSTPAQPWWHVLRDQKETALLARLGASCGNTQWQCRAWTGELEKLAGLQAAAVLPLRLPDGRAGMALLRHADGNGAELEWGGGQRRVDWPTLRSWQAGKPKVVWRGPDACEPSGWERQPACVRWVNERLLARRDFPVWQVRLAPLVTTPMPVGQVDYLMTRYQPLDITDTRDQLTPPAKQALADLAKSLALPEAQPEWLLLALLPNAKSPGRASEPPPENVKPDSPSST